VAGEAVWSGDITEAYGFIFSHDVEGTVVVTGVLTEVQRPGPAGWLEAAGIVVPTELTGASTSSEPVPSASGVELTETFR
jgi:hypothetical protein